MDGADWSARTAEHFGARLRELREAAGLSRSALGEKCGLTLDGIAQLESGRRRPMWESVLALAKALGVTCEAFQRPPGASQEKAAPRPPAKAAGSAARTPKASAAKGARRKPPRA
jgi:transcriptional regulator with XRE-family HTH domain